MSIAGDSAIIEVGGTAIAELTRYEPRSSAGRRDVSFTNNNSQKTFRNEPVEHGASWTAYFLVTDTALSALVVGSEVAVKIQLDGAGAGKDEISGDFLVLDRRDGGNDNGEVEVIIEGVFNTYTRALQP